MQKIFNLMLVVAITSAVFPSYAVETRSQAKARELREKNNQADATNHELEKPVAVDNEDPFIANVALNTENQTVPTTETQPEKFSLLKKIFSLFPSR